VNIANSANERDMSFLVRTGNTAEVAMTVASSTRTIGLYPAFPTSQVNIGGDLTVTGNLTVNGDTTVINTETLTIEDKVIQLANSASPSDATADGGGIVLKGDTDHTLLWTDASDAWNSSEHINLAVGRKFKIDGQDIVDSTTFYGTAIPNVTSFGAQNVINVGPGFPPEPQLRLENNKISTIGTNRDLEIEPSGLGNVVLLGSPRITGLSNPASQQDAATKEYVDDIAETRAVVFSMDLSDGKPNSYIITNILNNLAPPSEHRDGTYARILCTLLNNASTSLDIDPLISQTLTSGYLTTTGTAPALTNVAISTATIPSATISTQRLIKEFRLELGIWVWQSDTLLPP
jgi:hypothetical protein